MLATWYIVDPILSAGIGLFILPRTWRLLREAVGVLLEGTPASINMASVREMIAGTTGVKGVHDLHIWSLTSGMNAMSVHVVVGPEADHASVRQAIRERISATCGIHHQVELPGEEEAEVHL